MATLSADGQVCIRTMLVVVVRKELAPNAEKEGRPSIDTWKFSRKTNKICSRYGSECFNLSKFHLDAFWKVDGNLRQLHQKLTESTFAGKRTTLWLHCGALSVHADVYRRIGGSKNLWRTKLSVAIEDYLQAVHFFGSKVEVFSREMLVQRTSKPLSQPRRPAICKPKAYFFL